MPTWLVSSWPSSAHANSTSQFVLQHTSTARNNQVPTWLVSSSPVVSACMPLPQHWLLTNTILFPCRATAKLPPGWYPAAQSSAHARTGPAGGGTGACRPAPEWPPRSCATRRGPETTAEVGLQETSQAGGGRGVLTRLLDGGRAPADRCAQPAMAAGLVAHKGGGVHLTITAALQHSRGPGKQDCAPQKRKQDVAAAGQAGGQQEPPTSAPRCATTASRASSTARTRRGTQAEVGIMRFMRKPTGALQAGKAPSVPPFPRSPAAAPAPPA